MIIEEKEFNICLKHVLKPVLKKYGIDIQECHIDIKDKIYVTGVVQYQDTTFGIKGCCDIDYHDDCLCFEHIEGKIHYLFFHLDIVDVLKQFVKSSYIRIDDNACYIHYPLPIQSITSSLQQLNIVFKSTSFS